MEKKQVATDCRCCRALMCGGSSCALGHKVRKEGKVTVCMDGDCKDKTVRRKR